jgi:pimeloyl-ACP methyl ester carboxylesterase
MGGLVALKVAIAEPKKIRRLVLTATSGGVPVNDLHAHDWRPEYFEVYPSAARWIAEANDDLSSKLSLVEAATLLLWGDRDRISPVAVGERLQGLLPNAELHVIPGADHDLAQTHAETVGEAIANHLSLAS